MYITNKSATLRSINYDMFFSAIFYSFSPFVTTNKNLFYKHINNRLKISKDIPDMTSSDNSAKTSPVDKAHGFLSMYKSMFTSDDGSQPTVSINKSTSSLSNI